MPVYSYHCRSCEHEFSTVQSIDASARKKCPACNKWKLYRMVGKNIGVHFKGAWPDQRRKVVNARRKRQADRIEQKIQTGEITKQHADWMANIRDKYAHKSPYLNDPAETKVKPNKKKYEDNLKYDSSSPPKEPSTYGFDTRAILAKRKRKAKTEA